MSRTDLARLTLLLSGIFMTIYQLFGISQHDATKIDVIGLALCVFYCAVFEGE